MKKQKTQTTQTTQTKIEEGKIYYEFTKSCYYVVKEVNEEKGEAKILLVTRRTKDIILDDGEAQVSFQPLDYVKAFDDEPVTIKIKHLEKLNLKEIK